MRKSNVKCFNFSAGTGLIGVAGLWLTQCQFDRADRWSDAHKNSIEQCTIGQMRCVDGLEKCVDVAGYGFWTLVDNCLERGMVCAPSLKKCTFCLPHERVCDGQRVLACTDDGFRQQEVETCENTEGQACRSGACKDLCAEAQKAKSNVGCEYWGADLDNANISPTSNAAAQQFAIVVSNPQPDVSAHVTIEVDDALLGQSPKIRQVGFSKVNPSGLQVFKLGPREVDGSEPGTFNTGTGTALTRQAFRVRSNVPVVAYQFNPLDNVDVFSNDASLLKPVEALASSNGLEPSYVVMGWPQTIAITDNPNTNFNPQSPLNLRAFLTIVGTREDTRIRFTSSTEVIPGEGIKRLYPGDVLEWRLGPFDVLNLETGDFASDFTGSLVESDLPVVVFSGAEAADAPYFKRLVERACCADHLEEQLDPIRTAGRRFLVPHGPNRARAVAAAGAQVVQVPEPEYYRVLAVSNNGPTHLATNLPAPDSSLVLPGRGAYLDLTSFGDFALVSDNPVVVAAIQPSQEAGGVARPLPGGDPSLVIIPPVEQYRPDYVFLTPDKYAFDFIAIVAPPDATISIDGRDRNEFSCTTGWANGGDIDMLQQVAAAQVHRCQLSFPIIDPNQPPEQGVLPGLQQDGVHRVQSDQPIAVVAYGFDERVSYAYAAGTQLKTLIVR